MGERGGTEARQQLDIRRDAPPNSLPWFRSDLGQDACDLRPPPPVADAPALLDINEAGQLLRISRTSMYRHARAGRIPGAVKVGGAWRFSRAILLRWLQCGNATGIVSPWRKT